MLTCCLKCNKDTEIIDSKVIETKNSRTMLPSKCAACGNKKSRFLKNQEANGTLNSLGLITPLRKFPLLGDILF